MMFVTQFPTLLWNVCDTVSFFYSYKMYVGTDFNCKSPQAALILNLNEKYLFREIIITDESRGRRRARKCKSL